MKTAAESLEALKVFFSDSTIPKSEKLKLWHVLTALRGPDIEGAVGGIKSLTTEVIRHAAFGDQVGEVCGAYVSSDSEDKAKQRGTRPDDLGVSTHFSTHVQRAFLVLGLKWSSKEGK